MSQLLRFRQVGRASPQLLFRPLAVGNFLFQLFVGSQKLTGSLRDPLIEFLCDSRLLAQEPRLLQSDRCLVCRYIKQEPLSLRWKIRSPRTCDDHTHFSLQAQSQKQDRNVSISKDSAQAKANCVENRP